MVPIDLILLSSLKLPIFDWFKDFNDSLVMTTNTVNVSFASGIDIILDNYLNKQGILRIFSQIFSFYFHQLLFLWEAMLRFDWHILFSWDGSYIYESNLFTKGSTILSPWSNRETNYILAPSISDFKHDWEILLARFINQKNLNTFFSFHTLYDQKRSIFDYFVINSGTNTSLSMFSTDLDNPWFRTIGRPWGIKTVSNADIMTVLSETSSKTRLALQLSFEIFFGSFMSSIISNFSFSIATLFSLRFFVMHGFGLLPNLSQLKDDGNWEDSRGSRSRLEKPGVNETTKKNDPVAFFKTFGHGLKKLVTTPPKKAVTFIFSKANIPLISVAGIVGGRMTLILLLKLAQNKQYGLVSSALFALTKQVWIPYALTIYFVGSLFFEICHSPGGLGFQLKALQRRNQNFRNLPVILNIYQTFWLLSLAEQGCFFVHFKNFNFGVHSTYLESYFFTPNNLLPAYLNFSWLGFLLGSFMSLTFYHLFLSRFLGFVFYFFSFPFKTFYVSVEKNLSESKNGLTNFLLPHWQAIRMPSEWNDLFFRIQKKLRSTPFSKVLRSMLRNVVNMLDSLRERLQNQRIWLRSYLKKKTGNLFFGGAPPVSREIRAAESSLGGGSTAALAIGPFRVPRPSRGRLRVFSFHDGDNNALSFMKLSTFKSMAELFFKIDQLILTIILIFSFTTIPYYSFDYLMNDVLALSSQSEMSNRFGFRYNINSIPIKFRSNIMILRDLFESQKYNVFGDKNPFYLNYETAVFDREHYSYAAWPISFEALNYQSENFWTHMNDHKKHQRRKSGMYNKVPLDTLKQQYRVSWENFQKRIIGSKEIFMDTMERTENEASEKNQTKPFHFGFGFGSSKEKQTNQDRSSISTPSSPSEDSLTNSSASRNADHENARLSNQALRLRNDMMNNVQELNSQRESLYQKPANFSFSDFVKSQQFKFRKYLQNKLPNLDPHVYLRLAEEKTEQELAKRWHQVQVRSMVNMSNKNLTNPEGEEFYISFKKDLTAQYYENPVFRFLLGNDVPNFLKAEPATHQLTKNQEHDLDLLRLKMFHYYDSIKFYFDIKTDLDTCAYAWEEPYDYQPEITKSAISRGYTGPYGEGEMNFGTLPKFQPTKLMLPESTGKPFSTTSSFYRHQFKGTYKTVRDLFQVSFPLESNQPIQTLNRNVFQNGRILSFDKPLFNEYSYLGNSFLHEEMFFYNDGRPFRMYPYEDMQRVEGTISAGNQKIDPFFLYSSDDCEHAMQQYFGANNPFYVGWEKHQRRFIITSRILPKPFSLTKQRKIRRGPLPKDHRFYSLSSNSFNPSIAWNPSRNRLMERKHDARITEKYEPRQKKKKTKRAEKFDYLDDLQERNYQRVHEVAKNNRFRLISTGRKRISTIDADADLHFEDAFRHPDPEHYYYRFYTSWPTFSKFSINFNNSALKLLYEDYSSIRDRDLKMNTNLIDYSGMKGDLIESIHQPLYTKGIRLTGVGKKTEENLRPPLEDFYDNLPIGHYKLSMIYPVHQTLFKPRPRNFTWPGSEHFIYDYSPQSFKLNLPYENQYKGQLTRNIPEIFDARRKRLIEKARVPKRQLLYGVEAELDKLDRLLTTYNIFVTARERAERSITMDRYYIRPKDYRIEAFVKKSSGKKK